MKAAQSPEILFSEGNTRFTAGDLEGAAESYRLALELDPYFARASFNLGCAMERLGGPAQALPHFERAARLAPEWSQAHDNLGVALARVGRMGEAAGELETACRLEPSNAGFFNNLGLALSALSRGREAKDAFFQAAHLDPLYPEPHNNLSILLERFGHGAEAIESAVEALRLRPGYPEAHLNLANALKSQGRLPEAIERYREALRLNPSYEEAQSALLFALLYPAQGSDEGIFADHASFGAKHRLAAPPHDNDPDPERPLNIGYVSADFREHAVARFIEPVLVHHDRSRFRVFCYSNVSAPDQRSDRIAALCDRFTSIAGVPDEAVERMVRRDAIDILVDLSGHSAGNRLLLFARKPAPAQVTWLGYPFSTGLDAIDYRITDAVCDPPGETERYHSEKLVRLPGHFSCFLPPEEAPETGELPLMRNGFLTFGSFNNPAKITPETVALWSGVLRALPGSRMLIKGYALACSGSRHRLLQLFAGHGVEAGRLELMGNTPGYRDHLALYNRVDIALDSYPYNGTTTTCEALWMGVPVVTLSGSAHRSRVGESLLKGVGLEGLVAHETESFVEIARTLALDGERLGETRRTLRAAMAASPLTDGAGFTRALERTFCDIWGGWCGNEPAQAPEPDAPGRRDPVKESPDQALQSLLAPLRGGDRSALSGIQETLKRQLARDRDRALGEEDRSGGEAGEEGIRSETLAECAGLLFSASLPTPAELLCRYLEDRGYRSAQVSRTIGEVALSLGQPAIAAPELESAVALGDDSRAAKIKLLKAREQARLGWSPPRKERYLLVKAWGFGFWSDVNHLLGQLLLAEMTGRTPVVQWGGNSLFSDDPRENAFHNFFLPINDLTVWDLVSRGGSFYPPKWNRSNLALDELNKFAGPWSCCSSLHALERGEDVVVSDFHYAVNDLAPWIPPGHPLCGMGTEELYLHLSGRYLKVQPRLLERVELFEREHLAGARVLALHVRGGDKGGEDPGLLRLNELYHPEIARFLEQTSDGLLFLLTDDLQILERYRERYGERLVHTVSTRTGNEKGVHYQEQESRRALGEEVLIDTILATRCERFLGNGLSNVSLAAAQMKRWAPGNCRLFGARLDRIRQITLYGS